MNSGALPATQRIDKSSASVAIDVLRLTEPRSAKSSRPATISTDTNRVQLCATIQPSTDALADHRPTAVLRPSVGRLPLIAQGMVLPLRPGLPLDFLPVANDGILPRASRQLERFGFRDRHAAQLGAVCFGQTPPNHRTPRAL